MQNEAKVAYVALCATRGGGKGSKALSTITLSVMSLSKEKKVFFTQNSVKIYFLDQKNCQNFSAESGMSVFNCTCIIMQQLLGTLQCYYY